MEQIFFNPLVNIFLFFYKNLGENFVIAIILVTLILQLVLWPLSIRQYVAQKKMKGLQEKLKEVQDKRNAGKQLSVAEMQMASQAFKGMLAGCLPLLIQFPFLTSLYGLFTKIAGSNGDGTIFNSVVYSDKLKFDAGYHFHLDFLGLDLSKTIFNIGFTNISAVIILVILIIATIAAQYFQVKISTPLDLGNTKKDKTQVIDATAEKKKKHKKPNQIASTNKEIKDPVDREIAASPKQMQNIITGVIVLFSVVSPASLSVYWCARSVFVIILTQIQKRYIIKEK